MAISNSNDERWVIGVDEAGRGSLVGELIVAAYAVKERDLAKLGELGVKDSKSLTPKTREKLYKTLVNMGVFTVEPISPIDIDEHNINELTKKAVMRALDRLIQKLGGYNMVKTIIIDKFGDVTSLARILRARGFNGFLVVEERADSKYIVVSAASIIAKFVRDTRIRVLSRLYGLEGSGYPSDPKTVNWVKRVLSEGSRPWFIRYSWATLRDLGFGVKGARRKTTIKTLLDYLK